MAKKVKTVNADFVEATDNVSVPTVTKRKRQKKETSTNIRSNDEIIAEMSSDHINTHLDEAMSHGVKAIVTKGESPKGIINRISDNGEINLSNLTEQEIRECMAFGEKLDVHDVTSISNFGSDLQKVMNDSSKTLLAASRQVHVGTEMQQTIDNMMDQISQIDLDEIKAPSAFVRFVRKIPVLNTMFFSIKKFLDKCDNIEKKVIECEEKLNAVQVIALRDNTRLQGEFDDTVKFIKILEKLIVAAKMKSQEVETGLGIMKSEPEKYTGIQIQDMENFKHELDKKISNMLTWRLTFTQSLFRIRDIQRSNIAHANEVHETVESMMPMFRQQISQATALYNLKQGIMASRAVKEGFNRVLQQNADAAHDLAVKVAKETEENTITMETLRHNQEKIVQTMVDLKKVWDDGERARKENDAQVAKMHVELERISSGIQDQPATSAAAIENKYTV